MRDFSPEIDDLIAKVITNEATTAEQQTLQAWVNNAPENRHYFEDLKRVWVESAEALPDIAIDTDIAWAKVKKQINTPKSLTIKWLSFANIAKIAAVLLAIWGIYSLFDKQTIVESKPIIAENKVVTDTLNDGSVITLNKKSTLKPVFSKRERRVEMTGEAYFAVTPDKEKPFVIAVKNLEIKVVGTAFNVDNISAPGKIIVTVEEGKVFLKGSAAEIYLSKDERVSYNVDSGQFEGFGHNEDKNVTAYRTGKLYFSNDTKLKDLVKQINKLYNADIQIVSPEIEHCIVGSGYDPSQDLGFYLNEILTESIPLKVEKQGNRFLLSGKGCN
jgi:transmembrane sensor